MIGRDYIQSSIERGPRNDVSRPHRGLLKSVVLGAADAPPATPRPRLWEPRAPEARRRARVLPDRLGLAPPPPCPPRDRDARTKRPEDPRERCRRGGCRLAELSLALFDEAVDARLVSRAPARSSERVRQRAAHELRHPASDRRQAVDGYHWRETPGSSRRSTGASRAVGRRSTRGARAQRTPGTRPTQARGHHRPQPSRERSLNIKSRDRLQLEDWFDSAIVFSRYSWVELDARAAPAKPPCRSRTCVKHVHAAAVGGRYLTEVRRITGWATRHGTSPGADLRLTFRGDAGGAAVRRRAATSPPLRARRRRTRKAAETAADSDGTGSKTIDPRTSCGWTIPRPPRTRLSASATRLRRRCTIPSSRPLRCGAIDRRKGGDEDAIPISRGRGGGGAPCSGTRVTATVASWRRR